MVCDRDRACLSTRRQMKRVARHPFYSLPHPEQTPLCGLCGGESDTTPVFKQFITLGTWKKQHRTDSLSFFDSQISFEHLPWANPFQLELEINSEKNPKSLTSWGPHSSRGGDQSDSSLGFFLREQCMYILSVICLP